MPIAPPTHRPQGHQAAVTQRQSARRRGYDARWERARRQFLRENPICAAVGCVEAATCVDHRRPHRGNETLFWDRTNWQGLCGRCHSRKTAAEDGGFGNRRGSTTQG